MTMNVENGTKIINMKRNDCVLPCTKRKRLNLCFLQATVVDTKFIGNVSVNNNDKNNPNLPAWDYNYFNDEVCHLGGTKLLANVKHLE